LVFNRSPHVKTVAVCLIVYFFDHIFQKVVAEPYLLNVSFVFIVATIALHKLIDLFPGSFHWLVVLIAIDKVDGIPTPVRIAFGHVSEVGG